MGAKRGAKREYGQLYPVARAVVAPICKRVWKFNVEGMENLPNGPAIIAPNHLSVIDSFLLPVALPRRITYVGKAEYMDDWKTKHLFPAMGMVPIDRSGGSASQRALDTAARILDDGELFGIYPEGTRSRSGSLHKGRTGVARLSLRTGAPIVPVGLVGTLDIQPPDTPFPKPFLPITIRIGKPVEPGRFRPRNGDPLVFREMTDELMYAISQLSGQTYVNEYAGAKPASHDPVADAPLATTKTSTELLASAS